MSLRLPLTLMLSIIGLAVPAWADFETGMDAYDRGNYATALSEWRPLAEKGDAQAQLHLGMLYHQARGVPQDSTTARQWYEKAAAQDNAWARVQLGQLYANGDGVPQDYAKAREWYKKSAAQGYAMAQFNLGQLYANGDGVPQDIVQAYKWYSLAATNGDKPAPQLRDSIAKQMTPAQIAKAQKLAREWKPNNQ